MVAAHYGFTDITGIDFAKALCALAEKNVQNTIPRFPLAKFNIICDDVVNYKIQKNQTVFFFFNPFDDVIMLKVVKNILSLLKKKKERFTSCMQILFIKKSF